MHSGSLVPAASLLDQLVGRAAHPGLGADGVGDPGGGLVDRDPADAAAADQADQAGADRARNNSPESALRSYRMTRPPGLSLAISRRQSKFRRRPQKFL